MSFYRYPVCHRGRTDCDPIACIAGEPDGITEEQARKLDFEPTSFVCSGSLINSDREVDQDVYRLCFKNHVVDDMSDNDMQDLTSVVHVANAAMLLDSIQKVNSGVVEIPAAQAKAKEAN